MCVCWSCYSSPLSVGLAHDEMDEMEHNTTTTERRVVGGCIEYLKMGSLTLSLSFSLSIVIESVCRRSKRNKKKIRHPIHLEGNALSIYSLKRASSSSSSLRIVTERPFDRVEMDTVTSSSRPYCVTCHASPSPRSKVMMMMTIWWRRWPNVDDFPREKVRDRSPFTSSLLLLSFLSLSFLFIP